MELFKELRLRFKVLFFGVECIECTKCITLRKALSKKSTKTLALYNKIQYLRKDKIRLYKKIEQLKKKA